MIWYYIVWYLAGVITAFVMGYFHSEKTRERGYWEGVKRAQDGECRAWKRTLIDLGLAQWTCDPKTGEASWDWKHDVLKKIKEQSGESQ